MPITKWIWDRPMNGFENEKGQKEKLVILFRADGINSLLGGNLARPCILRDRVDENLSGKKY